jgi:hypothetical protein
MVFKILIVVYIVFFLAGCSGSFQQEGKKNIVQNFDCGNEQQEVNLEPGKYVVRLTSECNGENSITVDEQTHQFSGKDLVIEIPEGQKAKILCPGQDGKCKLTSVKLETALGRDEIEYLPVTQLGDECKEIDTLIAVSTAKANLFVFYSPCINGTIDIIILDETDSKVGMGDESSSPKRKDVWFNRKLPLEKGWRVYLKCIPGENSEEFCQYTLGWK